MIDRVFIAVLLLSISGVVFCAIFLPFEKLAFRLTSAKTMVAVNTAALFTFILPFYFIDALFIDKSEFIFQNYNILVFEDRSMYENAVGFVRELDFIKHLSWLWLLGVVVFSAYHLYSYIRLYKKVREGEFKLDDDEWGACFDRLKKENNLYNVKLIGSCGINTPCTIGLRNKYIIIPSSLVNIFDAEEKEFILRHEFYHLIHRDTLRMFLVIILSAANWFNPLFRFLKENLSAWQEIACDEEVTKNFSKKKRSKYCALTIKILEQEVEPGENKLFRLGFDGDDFRYHQRRLDEVMQKNERKGIWGKAVVASLAMFSMVSGNVVAKAADGPVNQLFSKNAEVVSTGEIREIEEIDTLYDDDFTSVSNGTTEKFVEFAPVDTEDTTYKIIYHEFEQDVTIMQDEAEPRHSHTFVSTKLEEHKKFSDGSCKTTYYDAKKCTGCGLIWKGDVIKETTYPKCPH